jgi:membrane fusion protein (multidrug efflux system)
MLWTGLLLLLLGGWLGWFALAPVTAYVTSASARVEVVRASTPLQAPVSGRLLSSGLVLDRELAEGELVLELDAKPQQIALAEQRARVDSLSRQGAALGRELEARRRTLEDGRHAARATQDEARARSQEADVAARSSEAEVARASALQARGLIAEAEAERLRAEAQGRRAAAEAQARALARVESEQRMKEGEQWMEIAALERELARLAGETSSAEQAIQRLEYEASLRRIRAPVAGRVGEVAELQPGAYVTEGLRLGTVVPAGGMRIIAEFPAPEAVGRLRAGQTARLRLDAFPWTQYGSVPARLERVANETREGLIRVELAVEPAPGSAIPVQHGLRGTVEVAVEETTPAVLALRAAGGALKARLGSAE